MCRVRRREAIDSGYVEAALMAAYNLGVLLQKRGDGAGPRDVDAVSTHNPFTVNDLWFSQQTGIALERMYAYGCSLIYDHPQGPTGARLIVELLHTLRLRGGGIGLFTGCAAGDTGAAVVVRVED